MPCRLVCYLGVQTEYWPQFRGSRWLDILGKLTLEDGSDKPSQKLTTNQPIILCNILCNNTKQQRFQHHSCTHNSYFHLCIVWQFTLWEGPASFSISLSVSNCSCFEPSSWATCLSRLLCINRNTYSLHSWYTAGPIFPQSIPNTSPVIKDILTNFNRQSLHWVLI